LAAIEVIGLVKRYGDLTAVDRLDLTVAEGSVTALVGPNGAGKSTTVEILEGYRSRDGGTVSVLGFDPQDAGRSFKERIGIVLQETRLEEQLTPRELFEVYGSAYPKQLQTDELIEIIGLEEKADARVKTLSGGQQRRVQLGLGIVGDPDLVFLDEPTTGFDPSARRQAWTIISNLRSLGKTILLTTHYLDEAQHLADRVAVMARGRIVAEGTPGTLGGDLVGGTVIRFTVPGGSGALPVAARVVGNGVEVTTTDPVRVLYELTRWALDEGVDLGGLSVTRPTLEDIYLSLTDGEASDE